ncbi:MULTISPECIES: peptide ABC transporter substrate-binding protein [Aerococcus]|uniref:Peptide ABC transporter substrate-binding protein n=3 Tax=Lactobacillales TaxID=186826 RepID=A0A178HDG2_9LACT|nr:MULTISPECIES: peptide ABC transporter substrate-binding protein [Aerococcus]KAA9264691.1 peptide ABC transporter substrate-binding protein [Aerococcus loyolae]MCY3026274.1 peptide ABC transporter substrate-binding protein [Aerococcus loyolae]MCY3026668.1 peptide ABC transporter substrate-binding protein [Aerococcus loyolae]MCY3029822.1 peptide ABC transporter substrate-binding protein [Aerococcus loyolae]MDK6257325.1 peptide ABC transporter substrate-binding protein [Aerococcus urinae]
MKLGVKGLGLLFSVLVALAGCSGGSGSESSRQTEITATADGELASLNSIASSDIPTQNVLANVTEGLYRPSIDGGNELGIAAEEPEVSEDGLTYTFKIRDNANWSTGEPVTAQDFVFSYRKAVDPNAISENVNKFFVIKNARPISDGELPTDQLGVKAIDDKTLEFTLEAPTPYFKGLLGTPAYLPQSEKLAKEVGDNYGSSQDNTAFNGPFVVDGWTGNEQSFQLKKNDQYWDKDNVHLDTINWQVSKEMSTNFNLFENGKVQYTKVGNPYVEQEQNNEALTVDPSGLVGYLQFNFTREPTNNVHLRKALASSFDKEAFVQNVLKDGSTPIDGWIPKKHDQDPETGEDFRAQNGSLSSYDVDKAKEEFEKAKADLGRDKISIELLTSDTDVSKSTSEFLQGEWQKNLPGIEVTIRNVPLKSRQSIAASKDYDIMLGTFIPSYVDPIAYLEYFESHSTLNTGFYNSEVFDGQLNQARTTLANQPKERWDTLLAAERTLVQDDQALAPIYQGAFANMIDPKLKGVINQTNGAQSYFRAARYEE